MKIARDFSIDTLSVIVYEPKQLLISGENPNPDPILKDIFKIFGMSEENRKKKRDGSISYLPLYLHNGIRIYRVPERLQIVFTGEFFILNPNPKETLDNFFHSLKVIEDKVSIERLDACRDLEEVTFKKIFPANLKIKGFNNPVRVKHQSSSPFSPIVGAVIRNTNISFIVYDKTNNINSKETEKNTKYRSIFGDKQVFRCEIQYLEKNKNNKLFKSMFFEGIELERIAEKLFKDFYKIHPAVNDEKMIRDCCFNKILIWRSKAKK